MPVTVKDRTGVKMTTVSLAQDLSARLREDILSGKLKDGQKLTEKSVCDTYGVSRTPVREALSRLETEGLVESIPNRGAFVRALSDQDIRDQLYLRRLHEIQAARWAAERISDEEMEELEETFEFMEFYTMKNDIQKMLNINRNFHEVIYKASHNRMIAEVLPAYQIHFPYRPGTEEENRAYLEEVLEEHRAIYEAIAKKDPEQAEAAMTAHMDRFIERHEKEL